MCVITICETEFPTVYQFKQQAEVNQHGAGLAWIDQGKVFWKKGLSFEEFTSAMAWIQKKDFLLNGPVVTHFRIATVGDTGPNLCHPFPIEKDASLALSGSSTKGVFFHNGTWDLWAEYLLQGALASGMDLPKGAWSDSRAMAWMIARLGDVAPTGARGLGGSRMVILRPDGATVFGRWEEPKGKGYCFSNDVWERRGYTTKGGTYTPTVVDKRFNQSGIVPASWVDADSTSDTSSVKGVDNRGVDGISGGERDSAALNTIGIRVEIDGRKGRLFRASPMLIAGIHADVRKAKERMKNLGLLR